MNKYYKLKLNCARMKGDSSFDLDSNYGYISFLPIENKTKTLFGKELTEKRYNGLGYVIAEKKDDFFEDIILEKRIEYNPNGLRNMENIKTVSTDKLLKELNAGLTCFNYEEISVFEVATFIRQMCQDKMMIKKYSQELEYILNKNEIKMELDRRGCPFIDEEEALEIIDNFKQGRSRFIKL